MTATYSLPALTSGASRRDVQGAVTDEDRTELATLGRAADVFAGAYEPAAGLITEIAREDASFAAVVAAHLSAGRALGTQRSGHDGGWRAYASRTDRVQTSGQRSLGLVLNGRVPLSAGGTIADRLVLPRLTLPDAGPVVVWFDRGADGVHVEPSVAPFGLRAAGWGTAELTNVWVPATQITSVATGLAERNWPAFDELLHAAIDVGILAGFIDVARNFLLEFGRPWHESGVDSASADPHTIATFGQAYACLHALQGLVAKAETAVGHDAFARARLRPVAVARGYAQLRVAQTINSIIATLGASSTSGRFGLDRQWRDFRAHSLLAPPRWQIRDVTDSADAPQDPATGARP